MADEGSPARRRREHNGAARDPSARYARKVLAELGVPRQTYE
jgi:hypothetical protein